MSPMLGREMARFISKQIDTEEIRGLLSTVELLFFAIGESRVLFSCSTVTGFQRIGFVAATWTLIRFK